MGQTQNSAVILDKLRGGVPNHGGTECCKVISIIFSQSEISIQKSQVNRENTKESE